ncbi:CDP-glycerol glycerophosphotransferase [Cytobacillus kochii]|nr:CDP-glycerol glycerophosphotransferase [Cytobacillus kochii]
MLSKIKKLGIIKKVYRLIFKVLGMLPARKNVIVFESFLGKQYSCNPRAIYEYLKINSTGYDMYWSIDPRYEEAFKGKDLQTINRFSISWLLIMARAKYWVFNSRTPLWIPKPKNTIYLQTWHGTPLKKLAADMNEVHMPGTTTEKYKRNFLEESSRWDYLISPNQYSTEIFCRAFNFNKQIIESGYPRNDILNLGNEEDTIKRIKLKLNIPLNKKVILYAPTWRDNEYHQVGMYRFNLKLDLQSLKESLGDEYVILLRMHYLIAENIDITSYKPFVYDVSTYEDIRELYLISDLLITDYSSVFFDYANLRRPMLFYVYDIESYRDQLRGFYFDFEKYAPGPLVKETEQLIEEIKILEKNNFKLPLYFDEFYNRFCSLEEGKSSKKVVETVFGKVENV